MPMEVQDHNLAVHPVHDGHHHLDGIEDYLKCFPEDEDDDESSASSQNRHLSFVPSEEVISVISPPPSSSSSQDQAPVSVHQESSSSSTQTPVLPANPSIQVVSPAEPERSPSNKTSRTDADAENKNGDHESNTDVAMELENLAAVRRLSLNVDTGVDPDLQAFSSSLSGNNNGAATSSADAGISQKGAANKMWVPAHVHPELAPNAFRSFMDSKMEQFQRRESMGPGDGNGSGFLQTNFRRYGSDGGVGNGGGLSRQKSLLSRQVDPTTPDSSPDDDQPILPPSAPALRRSTRTTYRKGSLNNGQRVPHPRRPRGSDASVVSDPLRPLGHSHTSPMISVTTADEDKRAPESEENESNAQTPNADRHSPNGSPDNTDKNKSDPPSPVSQTSQSLPQASPRSELPSAEERHSASSAKSTSPSPSPQHKRQLTPVNHVPSSQQTSSETQTQPQEAVTKNKSSHIRSRKSLAEIRPWKDFSHSTNTDKKPDPPKKGKSSWGWLRHSEDGKKKDTKSVKSDEPVSPTDEHGPVHDTQNEEENHGKRKPKEKESTSLLSTLFGGARRRSHNGNQSNHKRSFSRPTNNTSVDSTTHRRALSTGHQKDQQPEIFKEEDTTAAVYVLRPDIDYSWTRFTLTQEREIYRLAHHKLSSQGKPLVAQVLLSNFMYSYLAKVQAANPHMGLPTSAAENSAMKKAAQEQQQKQAQEEEDEISHQEQQKQQQQQSKRSHKQKKKQQQEPQLQQPQHQGQQQQQKQDKEPDKNQDQEQQGQQERIEKMKQQDQPSPLDYHSFVQEHMTQWGMNFSSRNSQPQEMVGQMDNDDDNEPADDEEYAGYFNGIYDDYTYVNDSSHDPQPPPYHSALEAS